MVRSAGSMRRSRARPCRPCCCSHGCSRTRASEAPPPDVTILRPPRGSTESDSPFFDGDPQPAERSLRFRCTPGALCYLCLSRAVPCRPVGLKAARRYGPGRVVEVVEVVVVAGPFGLLRNPFQRCADLDDGCLPNAIAAVLSELQSSLSL